MLNMFNEDRDKGIGQVNEVYLGKSKSKKLQTEAKPFT